MHYHCLFITCHILVWCNMHGFTIFIPQFGQHPLYGASFYGKLGVVKLLLHHGAQIDLPTSVSDHCNIYMYYQYSLAMHMIISLTYIRMTLVFMSATHTG